MYSSLPARLLEICSTAVATPAPGGTRRRPDLPIHMTAAPQGEDAGCASPLCDTSLRSGTPLSGEPDRSSLRNPGSRCQRNERELSAGPGWGPKPC